MADVYLLSTRTVFLAAAYIDRVLASSDALLAIQGTVESNPVATADRMQQVQALGAAAIHIGMWVFLCVRHLRTLFKFETDSRHFFLLHNAHINILYSIGCIIVDQ